MKAITIEGYSAGEILNLPDEEIDCFVFAGKPLVLRAGSAEILAEFKLRDVRRHLYRLDSRDYMSIEVHIFLNDSRVPSREAWQHAIDDMSFPTVLDTELNVREQTGFSPTIYAGQSTGFEFYLDPTQDILSSYSHIAERIGDREKCVTFRWGGDLTEMAAALSAAAALTKLADGVFYYPDDDLVFGADEAVETIRRDLSSL